MKKPFAPRAIVQSTAKTFFLIAVFIGSALLTQVAFNSPVPPAYAQGSTPTLTGYAWSPTIGWITFDTGAYAVKVDSNGYLNNGSGGAAYAWSPNVGWIQFGGLSGFPTGGGTTAANARIVSGEITGWAKVINAGTVVSVYPHTDIYTTTGTPTMFTIPVSVTSMTVKAWGGGGGGGGGGTGGYSIVAGGSGGGAGYAGGTIAVCASGCTMAPGDLLTIFVGDGGKGGLTSSSTVVTASGGAPGGGASGTSKGASGSYIGGGGGGGGYSGVFRSGTAFIVAGGGAGAGGAASSGSAGAGKQGGPGGGTSGTAGTNVNAQVTGGGAGTQAAGGSVGAGGGTGATGGGSLTGGSSGNNSASASRPSGGGGGGGYYGGGGGGGANSTTVGGAGGGGGSSFIAAGITSASNTGGSGTIAGNSADTDNKESYGTGGTGGVFTVDAGSSDGSNGNTGFVIITYTTTGTGGWDGWISLKGTNYSVPVSGSAISGYAWGGDIMGWINLAGVTIDAYLPTVTLTANDPNATEPSPADTGAYTVSRTGATDAALVVNFSVSGSATRNTDYALTGNGISGTTGTSVTIPAGSASTAITLTPSDDTAIEGGETATIDIDINDTVYTRGSPYSASVTITDNDCSAGFMWNGASCVVSSPTINTFYPSLTRVRQGGTSVLNWSITNLPGAGCTITSNPSGFNYTVSVASGSQVTNPINQTTDFTLDCGTGVTQKKTVTIIPTVIEI